MKQKRIYNNYELMLADRKNIIRVYGKVPRLTAKIVNRRFIGTATF